MRQNTPPVAVLVSHRVEDYEAWKKAFDEHKAARVDASFVGHHINRGVDDPQMVYLYGPASDARKVKAFMDSADLRQAMQKARVEGAPTITLVEPKHADIITDQKLPAIIVRHEVRDYDRWRKLYDDLAEFRRKSGIVGHAVNQELDKPNQVIVYHQATKLDNLRNFLDSPELKDAMKRAGVVGQPKIDFVEGVDYAEY
jgi:hypothetical protein